MLHNGLRVFAIISHQRLWRNGC